jgi:TorA maturation chaperone TorD
MHHVLFFYHRYSTLLSAKVFERVSGCRVPDSEVHALRVQLTQTLCTKLINSLRRHLRQLGSHLAAKFTVLFEEDSSGERRPWNSNLEEDAQSARRECARALAQVALVPQGFHVPGADEATVARAKVRYLLLS